MPSDTQCDPAGSPGYREYQSKLTRSSESRGNDVGV